jgi:hypothetical protein
LAGSISPQPRLAIAQSNSPRNRSLAAANISEERAHVPPQKQARIGLGPVASRPPAQS